MKRVLWIVAVLSLLTACHRNKGNADAYGNFEATEIIVSSENNGRLLEFSVEEGKTYQAGEVVGCIDTLQLCLQLKQLESSIKAVMARRPDSKSQIQVMKKQLETLEKERARVENLVQANAATAKQLDDIIAQINITKSQMAATESPFMPAFYAFPSPCASHSEADNPSSLLPPSRSPIRFPFRRPVRSAKLSRLSFQKHPTKQAER